MSDTAQWDLAPASARNMALLVELRWIAIAGQAITIWVAEAALQISLPLAELLSVLALLALVNGATMLLGRSRAGYSTLELLGALMVDVAALHWQLYVTGGATNPFTFLFLMQIVIGAILLHPRWSWIVALIACLDVGFLSYHYRPLRLPAAWAAEPFRLYLDGSFICFALIAGLLVFLVVRLDQNRRSSDHTLSLLRQQAVEEHHIIRIGLLASGAAHELGTPLASMSVILGDWARHRTITARKDLADEVAEMQAELARCKLILSQVLMSAGEVRGENPTVTTLRGFVRDIIEDWRQRCGPALRFHDALEDNPAIVSDPALRQVIGNVIDNAREVSPHHIAVHARVEAGALVLEVRDKGPGFAAQMLVDFGRPYTSTKGRDGGGLGLFLVANLVRKLGGTASARNLSPGAEVALAIPLTALAYPGGKPHSTDTITASISLRGAKALPS